MEIKNSYDVIVIGGGSAGYSAAKAGLKKGLAVAVIDSASELGGLCILRGCMPTKTLIETANRMRAIDEAAEFGINVTSGELNIQSLRDRKNRLVDGFKEYRVKGLTDGSFDLYRGKAQFVDKHHIQVEIEGDDVVLKSKTFVIATGSVEGIPPIDGLSGTPFWTSDDVVDLPSVPESVIVMGTGAIGMESAHLFQGLGSKVTILSRSKPLLSNMEPEISDAMLKRCNDMGIKVVFDHNTEAVDFSSDQFAVSLKHKNSGEEKVVKAAQLIMATGRKPRIKSLDLSQAGFPDDLNILEIDQYCQTQIPNIFAAGDCASPLAVVHLAVLQGEAAGNNAAEYIQNNDAVFTKSWDSRLNMMGIFTDPELVQIGMTEDQAKKEGYEVISASYRYDDQGKGEIVGEKHGLVKLLADKKNGRILGCSGMGPHVIDYAHTIMIALHQKLTVEEFVSIPSYHPTLGEIWSYVAEDLLDMLDQ
ncbi:MAG: dihydrolipoyl dehydrogenase family protein [Akkermansiaceae bacterium]